MWYLVPCAYDSRDVCSRGVEVGICVKQVYANRAKRYPVMNVMRVWSFVFPVPRAAFDLP